jgi:predicted lipoprotein with Yx(FWY)xxD motif
MQRRSGLLGLIGAACLVAALFIVVTPAGAASKPSAPGKPSVAPGMAQALVTWVAPANNGSPITGYVVTPFVGSKAQPAHAFNSTATAQTISGLTNARAYTFRVAAKNAVGTGAQSPASSPAIPTSAPTLRIATNAGLGKQIIVNSYGFTLYLFAPDGKATNSKVPPGIIKQTWPPVAWSGVAKVGPGLSAAKVAIHVQPNRTPQVSYNGHLLYTFVSDTKPGDVTGQNVAQFFVVSPAGNEIP